MRRTALATVLALGKHCWSFEMFLQTPKPLLPRRWPVAPLHTPERRLDSHVNLVTTTLAWRYAHLGPSHLNQFSKPHINRPASAVGRFGVSGDRDSVGHRSTAREPPWLGVGGHLVITEARTKLVERTPAAAQFLPSGTFFVVVPEIHPVLIAIVQHPLVVFRRRRDGAHAGQRMNLHSRVQPIRRRWWPRERWLDWTRDDGLKEITGGERELIRNFKEL